MGDHHHHKREWEAQLCGCCDDYCLCYVTCTNYITMDFLQMIAVDMVTEEGVCSTYCLNCWLLTIGHALNRGRLRASLNIKGDCCTDCLMWWCCPLCAVIQEYKEAKLSKKRAITAAQTGQTAFIMPPGGAVIVQPHA
jgi:Cys-rich protein (TIGR01571 family)